MPKFCHVPQLCHSVSFCHAGPFLVMLSEVVIDKVAEVYTEETSASHFPVADPSTHFARSG